MAEFQYPTVLLQMDPTLWTVQYCKSWIKSFLAMNLSGLNPKDNTKERPACVYTRTNEDDYPHCVVGAFLNAHGIIDRVLPSYNSYGFEELAEKVYPEIPWQVVKFLQLVQGYADIPETDYVEALDNLRSVNVL